MPLGLSGCLNHANALSAAGAALVTVPKTLSAEPCFDRPYPEDFTLVRQFTGSFGSWSVFIDKNPRQCWLTTKPIKTDVTERKIMPKICRNDPYLMVNFIPSEDIFAEVSYISGHDLDDNSKVEVISVTRNFIFHSLKDKLLGLKMPSRRATVGIYAQSKNT